jgi:hypothetical protein
MMQIISIKKEENFLKIALCEKRFNAFSVKYLEMMDLDKLDLETIQEKLKNIEKFQRPNALFLLGLSSLDVLEKNLKFPPLSWQKVKKLIPFQKEALFPYGLDAFEMKELYLSLKNEKEVVFLLSAKEELKNRANSLGRYSIEPEVAYFDSLGIRHLLRRKTFAGKGVFIHLNYLETVVVFYDNHQLKEQVVIDFGYQSLQEGVTEFTHLSIQIAIDQILKVRNEEEGVTILSGFFHKIPQILQNFKNGSFLEKDKSLGLYTLEIANAEAYLADQKSGLDLEWLELPKTRQNLLNGFEKLKKILFALVMLGFINLFILGNFAETRISKLLSFEPAFTNRSIRSIFQTIDKMVEQDKNLLVVLDLNRQPIAMSQVIETVSKPVLLNGCEFIGCNFNLEKYPQFKAPLTPFSMRVELFVKGSEKNLQNCVKEIKKFTFIDSKKGIKLEKRQDDCKLEFVVKSN